MFVRPCGVKIFKTQPRLRDSWTDVDETQGVYSTGPVYNFWETKFGISAPTPRAASPNLARSAEMTAVLIMDILITAI